MCCGDDMEVNKRSIGLYIHMNPTRPTLRTIDPDTHTALLYYLRVTSEDRASKGARRAAVRGKGNAGAPPRTLRE